MTILVPALALYPGSSRGAEQCSHSPRRSGWSGSEGTASAADPRPARPHPAPASQVRLERTLTRAQSAEPSRQRGLRRRSRTCAQGHLVPPCWARGAGPSAEGRAGDAGRAGGRGDWRAPWDDPAWPLRREGRGRSVRSGPVEPGRGEGTACVGSHRLQGWIPALCASYDFKQPPLYFWNPRM